MSDIYRDVNRPLGIQWNISLGNLRRPLSAHFFWLWGSEVNDVWDIIYYIQKWNLMDIY